MICLKCNERQNKVIFLTLAEFSNSVSIAEKVIVAQNFVIVRVPPWFCVTFHTSLCVCDDKVVDPEPDRDKREKLFGGGISIETQLGIELYYDLVNIGLGFTSRSCFVRKRKTHQRNETLLSNKSRIQYFHCSNCRGEWYVTVVLLPRHAPTLLWP